MNNRQKKVLIFTIILIFIIGIFPPWILIVRENIVFGSKYSLVFTPPSGGKNMFYSIDVSRYLIQLLTVVLVSVGLIILFKKTKDNYLNNKNLICPKCGTSNEPNIKFCEECGNSFLEK